MLTGFIFLDTIYEIIEYINVFRRLHGVGPVILSDEISSEAQKWALKISTLGTAQKDASSKYGNTICLSRNGKKSLAKSCVLEWYEGAKYYDWHQRSLSTKSMEFVQMIWKSSLYVGVGLVRGQNGRYFVVVYYDIPGNKKDEMNGNVLGYTGEVQYYT